MARITPFENYSDDYDRWFNDNRSVYEMELEAVRDFIPENAFGLDVGIGTGRFALPLGINTGIDPSFKMAVKAAGNGLDVCIAVGESLPFKKEAFDFLLMVTSICFFDDVRSALGEAWRVLKKEGQIIIGFVDSQSELGRQYIARKDESRFYREATFYSVPEIISYLDDTGFSGFEFNQTVFTVPCDGYIKFKKGYGSGSFVVIKGLKKER